MSDNADGAPSDKRNNRTVPALPMASDNGGALEPLTALDPELRDDFRGAYALNTVRTYRAAWRDWCAWCQRQGLVPLPAEPRTVRDYLADLGAVRRVSTLQHRVAAIAHAHKMAGVHFNRDDAVIVNVLRRLGRQNAKPSRRRAELMTEDIVRLLKATPPTLQGIRDRAVLLIGFAGGLRRSEIVDLKVNDIEFRREGLIATIRRSKGDAEGEGQRVAIVHGKRQRTCPVTALRAWLEAAPAEGETPLFRGIAGGKPLDRRMSDKAVWRLVKRYAARAGLDPNALGAHSLRIGHVTQARANKADLGSAQRQLRHRRIETTQGYDRGAPLRDSTSAKLGL